MAGDLALKDCWRFSLEKNTYLVHEFGSPKKKIFISSVFFGVWLSLSNYARRRKRNRTDWFLFLFCFYILKKICWQFLAVFKSSVHECGQYTECRIFARPHRAGTRSASTHFCSHTNCAKIRKSAEKLSTNVCVKLDTSMLLLLICQENRRNKSCYMVWWQKMTYSHHWAGPLTIPIFVVSTVSQDHSYSS